jgi:hypothetical protein
VNKVANDEITSKMIDEIHSKYVEEMERLFNRTKAKFPEYKDAVLEIY